MNENSIPTSPALYGSIKNYYDSGQIESYDIIKSLYTTHVALGVLNVNGISFSGAFGHINISKEEQDLLVNILKYSYSTLPEFARKGDSAHQLKISDYVIGFIIMLLANEISNMRSFYFRNNSETHCIEFQALEHAISEKDLEIERIADKSFKEDKEVVKPYASEISTLNSKIRGLEKELEIEREKNPELNALRKFAFAVKSEYTPPEMTIPLSDFIKGKKIIIVGGHISWRNKMKEKYPDIVLIDGWNVSFNNSIFDKAYFILLYVSRMSHKVHYKIIDYLRKNKLQFDYLGRSVNIDLLEAEIMTIMKDNE